MAQCFYPYYVERKFYHNQEDRHVPVPCGKCPNCLKRRVESWAFRLDQESKLHSKQFFITLTYNSDHVPLTPNTFLTLRKKDLQKFFKRLRKRTGAKLRYYAVGEYGTKHKRPHYHLILFSDNKCTELDILKSWIDPVSRQAIGNVHFGSVEQGSIRYTIQYYDKGDWKRNHERDDREPEFSIMSKSLGQNYLTPKTVNYIIANPSRPYLTVPGGKKIAIPEYYKKRIFDYNSLQKVVEQHPSLAIHISEMQDEKKIRQTYIKKLIDEKNKSNPDPADRSYHEDRKAAIANYRASKRKTRD